MVGFIFRNKSSEKITEMVRICDAINILIQQMLSLTQFSSPIFELSLMSTFFQKQPLNVFYRKRWFYVTLLKRDIQKIWLAYMYETINVIKITVHSLKFS